MGAALSRELALEAYRASQAHGTHGDAARSLGLVETTYKSRLSRAKEMARQGLLGTDAVLPGFEISRISEGPRGTTVEQRPERGGAFVLPDTHSLGKITFTVGPDGKVERQHVRAMPTVLDHDALIERIQAKYESLNFIIPSLPAPEKTDGESLNFFGLGDMHWGLRISAQEVGGEEWNIAKANRVYRSSFSKLMGRTPGSQKCVLMFGGDVTHQNDSSNMTKKSHHILDVDGTFQDAVEAAQEYGLDAALWAAQRHDDVELAFIRGNHDEESIVSVASFLRGAFRDNPRVTVTMPRNRVWVRQYGLNMLAGIHGDMMKPAQLPGVMAAEYAEMWGQTKFRYGHTFHVHHKTKLADEMGGVYLVSHQSPAPKDFWHYHMGFLSGRSFEVSMYHHDNGFQGSLLEPIIAA